MNQLVRRIVLVLIITAFTVGFCLIFFPHLMSYVIILFEVASLILSLRIIFRRRAVTSVKIAWILTLYCFPIIGFFLYLFVGRSNLKSSPVQIKEQKVITDYVQGLPASHLQNRSILEIKNERLARKKVLGDSQFQVLTDGKETFTAILDALASAEKHIHLFYYIVKDDQIANDVRKVLIKKAQAGVEVRFSIDGLGSIKLSDEYLASLKEANVEVEIFNPMKSLYFTSKANWRNHRKMIIIDGKIGFTGGLNIGNEYLGITERFSHWRDTHLKLEGMIVRELQEAFLYDWVYMKNKAGVANAFINSNYFPEVKQGNEEGQIVYGGPYDSERAIRDVLFNLIDAATESIQIASPYLVPDDEMLELLRRAARNGIKVEIIIPGKGDRKISYYGNDYYIEDLVSAGINVYKYDKEAFLHCKVMIIDGITATIGSTNFDIRSFQINHEISVLLYKSEAISKLAIDFENDRKNALPVTQKDVDERTRVERIMGKVCGLFAPLL